MSEIFPEPIRNLPEADIPLNGLKAYLSQADTHQILFMEFSEDAEVSEHSHGAQWGVVLDGEGEITINGKTSVIKRGDSYFIPKIIMHSAKAKAGYKDVTFFDQEDRYKVRDK